MKVFPATMAVLLLVVSMAIGTVEGKSLAGKVTGFLSPGRPSSDESSAPLAAQDSVDEDEQAEEEAEAEAEAELDSDGPLDGAKNVDTSKADSVAQDALNKSSEHQEETKSKAASDLANNLPVENSKTAFAVSAKNGEGAKGKITKSAQQQGKKYKGKENDENDEDEDEKAEEKAGKDKDKTEKDKASGEAEEEEDDDGAEDDDEADKETDEEGSEKDGKKDKEGADDEKNGTVVYETANATNESNDTAPLVLDSPFAWVYDNVEDVTGDVEMRRGPEFFPEGTHTDVDMSINERHKVDAMFSEDPSVYGNCILIRDFAEPLRVGSAVMESESQLNRMNMNATLSKDAHPPSHHRKLRHAKSHLARGGAAAAWLHGADLAQRDGLQKGDAKADKDPKLPNALLKAKGAVTDRDTDQDELQVNMYAFLRSVAGEVAVIPHGVIAKWGSKRRVPIAGYLCTSPNGPVLHTLPTPCMPTTLGDDGVPYGPPGFENPAVPPPAPAPAPVQTFVPAPAPAAGNSSNASAASAAAPPGLDPKDTDEDVEDEAEAEAEAEEAVKEAESVGASFMQAGSSKSSRRYRPAYPYHVWVGGAKLGFSSKPKADEFCTRLADRIATDLGDTEWDTDLLEQEAAKTRDMSLTTFVQKTRKPSASWTTGTKSLLVVVMDWMPGDSSRSPYSAQTKTPEHYEKTIFPRVKEAFQTMSYGKFDVDVTVVPKVIRYTQKRSTYVAQGYPFPGLYNGAEESMAANAEFGTRYDFDKFDLVYVISPQQAPTGTKGVAWVGAKGAMCNGCEEISENFQVMVAVHELGHNLGLFHASSDSLEYGNIFDWMGNYPDVQGLSYGLGYKLQLGWLPPPSVAKVFDKDLATLNDEFIIRPFDAPTPPQQGDLVGVEINLKENSRNLFVAFRDTVGMKAGVYLTWQDREKPNSELIDTTCHSPSQQDARLQQGWTYMDPSNKVVIYVAHVDDAVARIRVFKAPNADSVAAIRARPTFSDGLYKCPKSCQDADLLVSMYDGCSTLASDGYCTGGSITMSGRKLSIETDLCPQSCDACEKVMSESFGGDGCADKNIKIGDMTCRQAAAGGYCDYSTNLGMVGEDICPESCGKCPPRPANPSFATSFQYPTPQRSHGARAGESGGLPTAPTSSQAAAEAAEEEQEEENLQSPPPTVKEEQPCEDDLGWLDADGDGCSTYKSFIDEGKLTREEACDYGDGMAKVYCKKTCDSCDAEAPAALSDTCEDRECVSQWQLRFGKCWACSDWKAMCKLSKGFREDCPATCGLCKPKLESSGLKMPEFLFFARTTTTTTTTIELADVAFHGACEDQECVEKWFQDTGKCFKCSEFASEFCGKDDDFMMSCPKSCKSCLPSLPSGELACADDFKERTCKRYVAWGWCTHSHVAENCKASCGLCSAWAANYTGQNKSAQNGAGRHAVPGLLALVLLVITAALA